MEKEALLDSSCELVDKLKEQLAMKKELEDIVIKASNEIKAKEGRIHELQRSEEQLRLELVEKEALERRKE